MTVRAEKGDCRNDNVLGVDDRVRVVVVQVLILGWHEGGRKRIATKKDWSRGKSEQEARISRTRKKWLRLVVRV